MGEGKRGEPRVWEEAIKRIKVPLTEEGTVRRQTWFKREDNECQSSEIIPSTRNKTLSDNH